MNKHVIKNKKCKDYIIACKKNNKKINHSYVLQHCEGVDQEYFEKYRYINFYNIVEKYPIREEYLGLLIKDDSVYLYNQKLSIDFYKRYKDRINLHDFIENQKLSENDIKEILDDIITKNCLYVLFIYQILSESFLRSIKEYWIKDDDLKRYIVNYNKLSDNFRKEFDLDKYLWKNNWIYKSTKFKKEKLIETNLYECHDDHFIAYKAIRKDRYSLYNFQYKYLKNGIYESKADYNINFDSSFGLSVGSKKYCKEHGKGYCEIYAKDYIIVKCKVYYKDIAAIVHDGTKIRCSKIQILD